MKGLVLDTHVWIWWMLGDDRLPSASREFLDTLPADQRPILSEISLWEAAMLVDLGRLTLEDAFEDWLAIATAPATVRLHRLTTAVVVEMNGLPSDFHRDPADRLIIATARSLKCPLATHDRKISESSLIEIWNPART